MGKLLRNIAIGLAINFALSKAGQAVLSIADQIDWALEKIQRKDLKVAIRRGRVVGLVTIKIRILNRSAVSIYLNSYRATISQEGQLLGSVSTINSNIELPSQEPRTITAEFEVAGQEFTQRLENILTGKSDVLAPIQINGQITLSNGLMLPIDQQIEFFALT